VNKCFSFPRNSQLMADQEEQEGGDSFWSRLATGIFGAGGDGDDDGTNTFAGGGGDDDGDIFGPPRPPPSMLDDARADAAAANERLQSELRAQGASADDAAAIARPANNLDVNFDDGDGFGMNLDDYRSALGVVDGALEELERENRRAGDAGGAAAAARPAAARRPGRPRTATGDARRAEAERRRRLREEQELRSLGRLPRGEEAMRAARERQRAQRERLEAARAAAAAANERVAELENALMAQRAIDNERVGEENLSRRERERRQRAAEATVAAAALAAARAQDEEDPEVMLEGLLNDRVLRTRSLNRNLRYFRWGTDPPQPVFKPLFSQWFLTVNTNKTRDFVRPAELKSAVEYVVANQWQRFIFRRPKVFDPRAPGLVLSSVLQEDLLMERPQGREGRVFDLRGEVEEGGRFHRVHYHGLLNFAHLLTCMEDMGNRADQRWAQEPGAGQYCGVYFNSIEFAQAVLDRLQSRLGCFAATDKMYCQATFVPSYKNMKQYITKAMAAEKLKKYLEKVDDQRGGAASGLRRELNADWPDPRPSGVAGRVPYQQYKQRQQQQRAPGALPLMPIAPQDAAAAAADVALGAPRRRGRPRGS